MKYVQAKKAKMISNSPVCHVLEYQIEDKDINTAVVKISGRYPSQGWAINEKCKMMGFVLHGAGKLTTEERVIELSQNDMVLINPNEMYYWEGDMTILLPSAPAWYPEQYQCVAEKTTVSHIKQSFVELLKSLEELNLPKNQYLIWGSGPLAIRGIRESRDIDLIVSKQLWDHLECSQTRKMIQRGNIEIWNDCLNLSHKIEQMISHPDMIYGFPFMTLTDTIEWKRFMNRGKDLNDIALIESYLYRERF